MRNRNATVGIIRPLARYPETVQRVAMTDAGAATVYDLSQRDRVSVLNAIRTGDTVYVWRMHLLAERNKLRTHSPRRDLFWWARHLLARGVTVMELATNARATDANSYLLMLEEACEEATKGIRGRARLTARENGKAGGRPKTKLSEEQTTKAREIWKSRDVVGDKSVARELRRFRTGYSRARCYREFGPRGGQ